MSPLLPQNALQGKRIAISASDTPDLDRLGLLRIHFELALAEIARSVLVLGGKLAYGGDLRPQEAGGNTAFLLQELQKYGRRDQPFLVCLAWSVHRQYPLSELRAWETELGLLGRIDYLDRDGNPMKAEADRGEEGEPVTDAAIKQISLTKMREYMGKHTTGRVLIGGKRADFQGEIPGVMEEALVTLDQGQPLYLAGGFGGATADIAQALQIDDGNWLPPFKEAKPPDQRWKVGYDRVAARCMDPGWAGLKNGLSDDENRVLSASHRPSEIATLVSLGLGRMHGGAAPA